MVPLKRQLKVNRRKAGGSRFPRGKEGISVKLQTPWTGLSCERSRTSGLFGSLRLSSEPRGGLAPAPWVTLPPSLREGNGSISLKHFFPFTAYPVPSPKHDLFPRPTLSLSEHRAKARGTFLGAGGHRWGWGCWLDQGLHSWGKSGEQGQAAGRTLF